MNWKNISIEKDDVTNFLRMRMTACYMLFDWNYYHADYTYGSNEEQRIKRVAELLGDDYTISAELITTLTKLYNRVLQEDIEDFIQHHMAVCGIDRVEAELGVARAMSEILQR